MRAAQFDARREPLAPRRASLPLARKKKGKEEDPSVAFPFRRLAVPGFLCGALGPPAKQRGVAVGEPKADAAGARGAEPGDVTARRARSQAAQWPRHRLRGPAATRQLTHKEHIPISHRGRELRKTCPASNVTFEEIAKKLTDF